MLIIAPKIYRSAVDPDPTTAMLIQDSKVAWIGHAHDAPASEDVVQIADGTIFPALTDAHLHLFMLGLGRLQLSFTDHVLDRIEHIIDCLHNIPEPDRHGGWVQGCNLMEVRLEEQRLPTRHDLDLAFPDTPVLLRRYCGHVAVFNTAAMDALKLGHDEANPQGGIFHRDETGQLTGIAEEAAAEWIFNRAPCPPDDAIADAILVVIQECLSYGAVSLVEAAVGFSVGYDREVRIWDMVRTKPDLPVRLGFMAMLSPYDARARGLTPHWSKHWSIETLKFFADGIIGGRSGAVSEPYHDTGTTGEMIHPPGVLEDHFAQTHADGWRIAVHATGDVAVSCVAQAIDAAQGDDTTRRHRIEHCFVPPDGVFTDLAAKGISVVMQPGFINAMGASILKGLGQRASSCYPGASVLAAGGALTFSSDAPTGPLSPWQGIQNARTRTSAGGDIVGAAEAVSVAEALHAYIEGGAHAMRHEGFRGTLEIGMAADVMVLNCDPFETPAHQLKDVRATLVLKDGKTVYSDRA
jgi:predicted amidohydrolase YtcJ